MVEKMSQNSLLSKSKSMRGVLESHSWLKTASCEQSRYVRTAALLSCSSCYKGDIAAYQKRTLPFQQYTKYAVVEYGVFDTCPPGG